MRCNSRILAYSLILTILLIGAAGAVIPDLVTFTTSKEWMVANGADSATLFIKVINATNPAPGLRVDFSLNDTGLAILNATPLVTDLDGVASPQLYAKTKSGTVLVSARVSYRIDDSNLSEPIKYITYTCPQKIDHDSPDAISYDNFPNGVVTVGTELPITINIEDNWHNVVENKNPVTTEKINLYVEGSPGDLAVFWDGTSWVNSIDVPVDSKGNFNVTLKLSTIPGFHSIRVKPLDMQISPKSFYIRTIANGIPARVVSRLEIVEGGMGSASGYPYPYIVTDGFSKFLITYTVYDQYGNPVNDRVLNFSTTLPEEQKWLPSTTDQGDVKIFYGPKDQVGIVTLNVVSIDNASVTVSNTVQFVNNTASEMLLTANPETMPSRDVVSDFTSEVRSKVVDEMGNGVPGETVTFSLGPASYLETYTITDAPSLDSTSAVSDSDGFATVYFRPGGFTPTWGDPHYDETATGRCNVTATWNGTNQQLMLSWKNYPYLSAEAYVTPNVVNVTDNVTVTLRLKGDGWALQPKPIDVVLCTDRSGSMLEDNPDRMVAAMNASKIFNAKMNVNRDRVGLVSFGDPSADGGWARMTPEYVHLHGDYYCYKPSEGWRHLDGNYYDWTNVYGSFYWVYNDGLYDMSANPTNLNYWPYTTTYEINSAHQTYINNFYKGNPRNYGATMATVEQTLSFNHTTVNNSIDQMVPSGGTPMREGLYNAVKMLRDSPRSGAVAAVVLLSDGDWNTGGDPLGAAGAVEFPADSITHYTSIINWAKQRNISIYTIRLGSAGNEAALKSYASQTGGKYYWAATPADLDAIYTSIAGDLQTEAGVATMADMNYGTVNVNQQPDSNVFNYVPSGLISTMNRTYWKNDTANNIKGPYYYNQTMDWYDKILSFDVGTIKLNQVWETTYMLQVLKPGNIDVFGIGSKISFNNNTATLLLPKTLITALPDMNTTGSENVTKTLTIDDLIVTTDDNSTIATLSVDIKILPESPNLNVLAEIYITDEDQHITTWIKTVNISPVVNGRMDITTVDLSQFQRGKQYTFYVDFINKQPGTNPVYWAQLTSNRFVRLPKPSGVYIRLE